MKQHKNRIHRVSWHVFLSSVQRPVDYATTMVARDHAILHEAIKYQSTLHKGYLAFVALAMAYE